MLALSQAMGMGEQSIHNAFGGKQALFERALGSYCSASDEILRALSASDDPRRAIERFFARAVDGATSGAGGCLVAQTCLTLEDGDSSTAELVASHLRKTERHLAAAVRAAIDRGQASCESPTKVARFLTMSLQGLAVMARCGSSRRSLNEIVKQTLRVLDDPG